MKKSTFSMIVGSALTVGASATMANPAFDSTDYLGIQAASQGDYSGYQINAEKRPDPRDGYGFAGTADYNSLSDDLDITDYSITAGFGSYIETGAYDSYASVTGGYRSIDREFTYNTGLGYTATDSTTEGGLMLQAAYEIDFEPVVAGVSLTQADVGDFGTASAITLEGRYPLNDAFSVSAGYDMATGDVYDDNMIRAGVTFHPDWF